MAINAAGTKALGDYLVSRIVNARTLMGLGASTGSSQPTTTAQLRDQVRAQKLANTQILFGIPTADNANANALPPLASQTPQQLATVAVQSSRIALQFSTIATLFGSRGIGSNTNTSA